MKKDNLQIFFSVASLIIAMIALFLSYQANQLARQNNTPGIQIVRDDLSRGLVYVKACQNTQHLTDKYQIMFIATHPITIANNGGRNVSITSIFFHQGERYSSAQVFKGNNSEVLVGIPLRIFPENEKIDFPISLETGSALDIYLQVSSSSYYENENDASKRLNTILEEKQSLVWTINFSNGEQIILEKAPDYSTSVSFEAICDG